MTHGSLFSGIGGFDLAAEWMGWENKFHCEWNEFGQRVLHHYWPDAELFTDITKSNFTKYANTIDVLTGGFPCQPYSAAGKRLGKEDERHLWPEMLRAIKEIAPRYVVGENVRGLTNWNGGMVFDEVCTDLENLGYQVAPYLIPACATNAPHRRERIWFVAYATSGWGRQQPSENSGWQDRRFDYNGTVSNATDTNGTTKEYNHRANEATTSEIRWQNESNVFRELCSDGNATDTDTKRFQSARQSTGMEWKRSSQYNAQTNKSNFENFPTQSPICGGDDGISTELDGITFSKWRKESIKAYGNAVVPHVVYQIFKAIEAHEQVHDK